MTSSGVLIIDKPTGLTSHDVVNQLRKIYGTRRVGHAGTLDPLATGILVVGINSATRLLGHLSLGTKEYQATIRLGAGSSTDDSQGDLGEKCETSGLSDQDVRSAFETYRGTFWQVPSSVSAKRVKGQRAHELVRAGLDVELEANQVHIDSINIHRITRHAGWVDVEVSVICSTGTFIRAIARDVGQDLKVGGHVTQLRRTRVGPFSLDESVTLTQLLECENPWESVIDMSTVAKRVWPHVVVSATDRQKISFGQRLSVENLPSESLLALLDENGTLLALAGVNGDSMEYRAVFVAAS